MSTKKPLTTRIVTTGAAVAVAVLAGAGGVIGLAAAANADQPPVSVLRASGYLVAQDMTPDYRGYVLFTGIDPSTPGAGVFEEFDTPQAAYAAAAAQGAPTFSFPTGTETGRITDAAGECLTGYLRQTGVGPDGRPEVERGLSWAPCRQWTDGTHNDEWRFNGRNLVAVSTPGAIGVEPGTYTYVGWPMGVPSNGEGLLDYQTPCSDGTDTAGILNPDLIDVPIVAPVVGVPALGAVGFVGGAIVLRRRWLTRR